MPGKLLVCGGDEGVGGALHSGAACPAHAVGVRVNIPATSQLSFVIQTSVGDP
jgi:hypothetical protein